MPISPCAGPLSICLVLSSLDESFGMLEHAKLVITERDLGVFGTGVRGQPILAGDETRKFQLSYNYMHC